MKIGNIRLNVLKIHPQSLAAEDAPSLSEAESDPYVLAILRRLSPSADEIAHADGADDAAGGQVSSNASTAHSPDSPATLSLAPQMPGDQSSDDKPSIQPTPSDEPAILSMDLSPKQPSFGDDHHHFLESTSLDLDHSWFDDEENPSKLTSLEATPDGWFDFGPSPFPPVFGGFPLLDDLPPGTSHLA